MKESLRAVVASRIVPPEIVAEFQRWALLEPEIYVGRPPRSAVEAARVLGETLDLICEPYRRETDLTSRQEFIKNKRRMVLHNPLMEEPAPVMCCVLRSGEYLFSAANVGAAAEHNSVLHTLLLDPETYLTDGDEEVWFQDVRNIYADELLIFVAATPCEKVKDE